MNAKPHSAKEVHEVEAFGPVSTIMPYKNLDEAIELGNLVKEVFAQL
jgi:oxepin-CoA hydrolase/3-oxo-5,6-dehydrosuberyl-CoA semialdehyde dehydrogenase